MKSKDEPREGNTKKRTIQRALQYTGYVSAILTIASILGPRVIGQPNWGGIFGTFILPFVLAVFSISVLWSSICSGTVRLSGWLFRKYLNAVRHEVYDFVETYREEMTTEIRPDYELAGAILKKEGYRHISARVETLQTILEGMLPISHPENDHKLRITGRMVGRNFVQTTWLQMQEHVLDKAQISGPRRPSSGEKISAEEINRRLNLWAGMELTAGWGEFKPDVRPLGDGLTGVITVADNFLTAGRTIREPRLCAFLEGYIEEIVSGLTGRNINVREVSCGREMAVDKICTFLVEPKSKKEAKANST